MTKRIFNSLLTFAFLSFTTIDFASVCLADECTHEQAVSKMRALSQARVENMGKSPEHQQRYARLAIETAGVGKLLAKKDFAAACRQYETIAKKYKIDLPYYESKLADLHSSTTTEGGCDVIAASKKVNGIYPRFRQKISGQNLSQKERAALTRDLFKALDQANPLIQTEPTQACKVADQIAQDFQLD